MDPEPGAGGGDGSGAGDPTPGAGADTNPGAFDPDAFMTKLLGEFDKRVNAMDKRFNKLTESVKAKPVEPPAPKVADPIIPEPTKLDPPTTIDPSLKGDARAMAELNARLQSMQRTLEQVTVESEERKKLAEQETEKRLETERIQAFDSAITDIPFADAKARQTFRKAYLNDIVRDEDGNLVAMTDKGPMAIREYLVSESQSQPTMLLKEGHSGAGATGGKRTFNSNKIDIFSMSSQEIAALKPEVRDSLLVEAAAALTRR